MEKPTLKTISFPTWLIYCAGFFLFLMLCLPYIMADFWMDELIPLYDQYMQPELKEIFTVYTVPRHILFSAWMWCWYRIIPDPTEFWMRIPAVIMLACLTFWLSCQSKRFPHTRYLIAFALGFSPVLLQFWLELRGYGASMLLATLATIGTWDMLEGRRWQGFALVAPALLLLPGIMFTNGIWLACQVGFIALLLLWRGWREYWKILLAMAGVGLLGVMIYFPIIDQVLQVMKINMESPAPWPNFIHIAFSLLIHLAIPFLLVAMGWYEHNRKNNQSDATSDSKTKIHSPYFSYALLNLLLACLAIAIPVLVMNPSPFPRLFLIFFPTFIIVLAKIIELFPPKVLKKTFVLFIIFLLHYLLVSGITDWDTQIQFAQGKYPQNLLEQYYKKNQDISQTAQLLMENIQTQNIQIQNRHQILIIACFNQYLSFRHYWTVYGGHPQQVLNIKNTTPEKMQHFWQRWEQENSSDLPMVILVVAGTAQEAESIVPSSIQKHAVILQPIHDRCFVLQISKQN